MQEIIAFGLTKIELIIIFVGFLSLIVGVAVLIEAVGRRKNIPQELLEFVERSQNDHNRRNR